MTRKLSYLSACIGVVLYLVTLWNEFMTHVFIDEFLLIGVFFTCVAIYLYQISIEERPSFLDLINKVEVREISSEEFAEMLDSMNGDKED